MAAAPSKRGLLRAEEVTAANASQLSGTLQRAVKAALAQYVAQLAQALKLRQGVVATAVAYLRRFYARCSFREHDPRHIAPACLFLAAKVEESAVTAKALSHAILKHWTPEGGADETLLLAYRLDDVTLNQKELVLIEKLDFQLIAEHPYQHLETLLADPSLAQHTLRCLSLANDAYRLTDLCLLHAPEVVAVACLMLAVEADAADVRVWAQRIAGVCPDAVLAAVAELLESYARPRLDARACQIALAGDD